MEEHYEEYWNRPKTYVEPDPLSFRRREIVWQTLQSRGVMSGQLLDAGCGEGDVVAEASARGWSAQGFDISSAAVLRAREANPQGKFSTWSVDQLPWSIPDGSVDVVTSFEVIEHLLHPKDLLEGSRQVLRQGGILFISTPYHGVVKNLTLSVAAFDKHFDVEGDHIRFFTDKALHRLFVKNGFDVVKIHHIGRLPWIWANSLVVAQKR